MRDAIPLQVAALTWRRGRKSKQIIPIVSLLIACAWCKTRSDTGKKHLEFMIRTIILDYVVMSDTG